MSKSRDYILLWVSVFLVCGACNLIGYYDGKQSADRYYAKHVRIEIIGSVANGVEVLCYSTNPSAPHVNGEKGCALGTLYDAQPTP